MDDTLVVTKDQLAERLSEAQQRIAQLEKEAAEQKITLQKEREFKDTVLDVMEDTVFVFEPATGRAVRWNESFRNISGYSDSEIASMRAPDAYYSKADLDRAAAAMTFILGGASTTVVMDLITKNGERIPTEYVGGAVPDDEGNPHLIISIGRDIRRRIENEHWLDRAQSIAKIGHWRLHPATGEISGSDGLFNLFGVNLAEATFESLIGLMHPEDRESGLRCIRLGIEHGESWDIQLRLICRDGTEKVIHVIGDPVLDDQGKTIEMVGTVQDITDRKHDEEAIRLSEERFRTLSESSPMGIFLTDENGCVQYLNDRWCFFSGMRREDALGFGWVDALHPDDKPRVLADWNDCLEKKKGYSGEFRFIQSTGEARLLYTRTSVIFGSSGEIVGHVGVNEDITDRRNLEERLRQTEKMEAIGQLAGGIAHDFNNQLAGILGYADMLRKEAASNPVLTRYADNILLAGKRASDLTRQLLAFSRKGKYRYETIDLHRIVLEVVSLLERSIDKRISVGLRLEANHCTVTGDPTQIQSAILNLALNARDAMPNGGELAFATDLVEMDDESFCTVPHEVPKGRYVQVSVTDTGAGMDQETRAHIFEPFFTTKEPGMGTGMGLAAVYGTVKNHSGTISVDSDPGHGSTFKIYLPLASESALESESAEHRWDHMKSSAHILVVEDEELVRNLVAEMLETLGHMVTLCGNGREAVELYKKEWRSIDLVILDLVMPVMGGKECFIEMRKINPNITALLSSGFSITGEAQSILEEGVKDFIQKPFSQDDLSQKVAKLLPDECLSR
jgi:PAS domain S-box-containing protein